MDPVTGGMLAMGGANLISNIFTNKANMEYQQEQLDYMKQAQQTTWDREDNAVQRRVTDLKAAGLSPVLAAGSAASTSAPIKIDPMHSEDPAGVSGGIAGATAAMGIAQSASNLKTQQAQRELLDSQKDLNSIKTGVLGKEFGLYDEIGGHPKYQDIWGKRISEILRAVRGTRNLPTGEQLTPDQRREGMRPTGLPNLSEMQMRAIMNIINGG